MLEVTIIVPCYNEQETISLLLEAILAQSYPVSRIEVVIADGCSSDQTRTRIQDFQARHPELAVKVVDNYPRVIPAALNRAIEAAQGEFIIRLDAHSIPAPDYVERCIAALKARRGENVGGVWHIRPGKDTWIARSIAAAASHPLGVGDALYRLGGPARAVDTVPFGAFYRRIFDEVGYYDEQLLTNEDYELNTRIRQRGGVIWFDPDIRSIYFARKNLSDLARQYARYGYWKAQMLRRYPDTLRWRQFLPPAFVAALIALALSAPWLPFFRWLLLLQVGGYNLILWMAGAYLSITKKSLALLLGLPLAIATMHLTWGAAFLWGVVFPQKN